MQAGPMQHVQQTSLATIASTVAAADDEGVDQPQQQPLALTAAPSGTGDAAAPHIQQLVVEALAQLETFELLLEQRLAESRATRKEILAALAAHAPPTQAPQQQPPPPQSKPKVPKAKQAKTKQTKQPQPAKSPTQQPAPLYAEVLRAGCGAMVTAMLAPAMQTQPQWQEQPHQRKAQQSQQQHQQKQQNPQQTRKQSPRQERSAVGVDRFPHLLHFTVSGRGLDTDGSAVEVVRRVVAKVEGGDGVVVVDAVRLGPAASPRFQFKVATLEQADTLVRGRGKAFAGSGVVLSEVLTVAEQALHKQNYQHFLAQKAAGHRVQFRRARLFVDGQLWSKAEVAAA